MRTGQAFLIAIVLGGLLAAWNGGVLPVLAQDTSAVSVRYDSSDVAVRSADPALLDRFRQDPAFDYDEAPDPADPWWLQLWRWFARTVLDPLFSRVPGVVYRWVLYGLVAVALVYAVTRLLRLDVRGLLTGRGDRRRVPFEDLDEDLDAIDFDQRIAEAEARGRYREAVRWHYLYALQRLAAADLITWRMDKTNHEYLRELPAGTIRRPFADLTYRFEHVWYGDQPIDAERYERTRQRFEQFRDDVRGMIDEGRAAPAIATSP